MERKLHFLPTKHIETLEGNSFLITIIMKHIARLGGGRGTGCIMFILLLCSVNSETQTDRIFDSRPGFPTYSDTEPSAAQGRIIGGSNARQGRYPYFVSLIDFSNRHTCGGSLVAPDVVLTAAHCQDVATAVQIGRWNRLNSSDDFDEIDIQFPEFPHPNYVNEGFKNDFMLQKLDGLSTKPYVRLNDNPDLPVGNIEDEVTVMGFGNTISGIMSLSNILQEVALSYVPNAICELAKDSTLDLTYQDQISDNMLCAGDSGQDSCQGDSGGPLIVSGGSAEQDVLVGVISWGFGCALPAFPGVYSRISAELEWLRATICEISDAPPDYLACDSSATETPRSVPVTVAIQLDDFPEEISWSIQDSVDGTVYAEVTVGTYTDAQARVRETVFLPGGKTVVFRIDDSFGDGLCCNSPGNYLVSLGSGPSGEVLVSGGGGFDGAKSHEFDVPTEYKDTNEDDAAPAMIPGQIPLTVVLQLDANPQEIGWKVEQLAVDVEAVIDIPAGIYKSPGARIVRTIYLEENELYYFRVYDVSSNGIDDGIVKLFLGTSDVEDETKKIFEAGGDFKGGVDFSFLANADPKSRESLVVHSDDFVTLKLYLDMYPGEIAFQVRAKNAETAIDRQSNQDSTVIFFRPPRYYSDYANQTVTEQIPIPLPGPGTSRDFILIVTDSFADGLCCNANQTNKTGYTLFNGDPTKGQILVDSSFIGVAREVNTFSIESPEQNDSDNNEDLNSAEAKDLIDIKVTITLDKFPDETGFYIEDAAGFRVADFPAGMYKNLDQLVEEVVTLSAGFYTFTITDVYGDGINRDGSYYRIDVVGSDTSHPPVIAGNGLFVTEKSHAFVLEGKSATYPMTVKFTTDEKPEEFSFVVKRLDTPGKDALVSSFPKGTFQEKSTSVTETIMVKERSLYRVIFEDAGKDGMGGQIEVIMGSDSADGFNAQSFTIDGTDLSADQIKVYAGQPPVSTPDSISLDLRIKFDKFPHEVEWILVAQEDTSSSNREEEVIAYGPIEPYSETLADKEHVETILLPDFEGERVFSIIVSDTAGDGVCCSFGSGGPVELYKGPVDEGELLFSESFEGVERIIQSFEVVGNKVSDASGGVVSTVFMTSLWIMGLMYL